MTVVGNTGDDIRLFGLQISPDLDTVCTPSAADQRRARLGPRGRDVRGQGRARGVRRPARLVRARRQGHRHAPGAHPDAPRRLPAVGGAPRRCARAGRRRAAAAHDRRPGRDPRRRRRRRAGDPPRDPLPGVVDQAPGRIPGPGHRPRRRRRPKAGPGVAEAIRDADVVVLPPSNPVVSIGTILQVPGVRDAVRQARGPVVGVSPIVGGAPVRGMADACLTAIGVDTTAAAVARHYGARGADGRARRVAGARRRRLRRGSPATRPASTSSRDRRDLHPGRTAADERPGRDRRPRRRHPRPRGALS